MRISLLAFLLVASATVSAQPSFGVKAGLDVATVLFEDGDDELEEGITKQPRLGFTGGLTVDVPFTPMFGLRAEALYAQKGYVLDFDFSDVELRSGGGLAGEGQLTTRIDYLEVPVLLGVMIPLQDGLGVDVHAGLAPAFRINTGVGCGGFEFEIEGEVFDGCEEFEDDDVNFDDAIKSFDLGAALGLRIGAGPFAVDARYTRSLSSIAEAEFEVVDEDRESAFNSVFAITGVYRFGK